MGEQKRKRGRPFSDNTMIQIAIRLPKPLLDYVDDACKGRLDGMDRSTLIRQLLAEAIEARNKGGNA